MDEHLSNRNNPKTKENNMQFETMKLRLGPRPTGFLTNPEGKPTHAIIPILDVTEENDWDSLPTVEPDESDRAFIARFHKNPQAYLEPAPTLNPIRLARLKAKVTQEVLANAMDITPAALSKQEQEGHNPRPRTIDRALKALGGLKSQKK